MDGMGDRLRARTRALGWSDTEVARRVGVGQTRYANYVTDRYEPDLATLARICTAIGASADELLGRTAAGGDEAARLRGLASAAMEALDARVMAMVVAVVDGLVATSGREPPLEASDGLAGPLRRGRKGARRPGK